MLPVALGLGLVNFNLLINSTLGFKISDAVPRAIESAFRLYMMPQGIFSVAIATVLFPALSRAAARHDFGDLRTIIGDGMRLILVLLIPAAAVSIALAAPIVRLLYQRGEFDAESTKLAAEALWVFSLTLPLNGLNLLLTRTFFALKDPWTTTRLAVLSLLVNLVVSVALYQPLGDRRDRRRHRGRQHRGRRRAAARAPWPARRLARPHAHRGDRRPDPDRRRGARRGVRGGRRRRAQRARWWSVRAGDRGRGIARPRRRRLPRRAPRLGVEEAVRLEGMLRARFAR